MQFDRQIPEALDAAAVRDHKLVVEGRQRVTVTTVADVDSFNENEIIFLTAAGMMTLTGEDLHISRLSLEEGILIVEGTLESVDYADLEERRSGKKGLFKKVFK